MSRFRSLWQASIQATKRALGGSWEDLMPPSEKFLFNFNSKDELKRWHLYSDSELGGLSSASLEITDTDSGAPLTGVFSGNLSLDLNEGSTWRMKRSGFCGMRSKRFDGFMDLDSYDTVAMRLRGDGRSYISTHRPTNSDQSYDNKRIRRPIGVVAVLLADHATFLKEMEKLPTLASLQSATDIPLGLRCPLCREVMKEAFYCSQMLYESFCDKCIRDHIIKIHMCECGVSNALVENLKPNRTIRDIINELLSWSSCTSTTNSTTITSPSI